jgi:hypothetical protein
MLLARPYSLVSDAPKTSPALKPPIDRGLAPPVENECTAAAGRADDQTSLQLPNLNTAGIGVADEVPTLIKENKATSAARNPGENRMVESPWILEE